MSDRDPVPSSAPKPADAGTGSEAPTREPYEAPRLVDYGDIATLTQTGGLTKADTGSKKQRIG